MRDLLHRLLILALVLGLLGLLGLLVAYPMLKCGFWAAVWLGRGALPAALMGMCG